MKLRITKGRIACAVVLLPVLYVLNVGPVLYCCARRWLPAEVFQTFYEPLDVVFSVIRLSVPYQDYKDWWFERGVRDWRDGGTML